MTNRARGVFCNRTLNLRGIQAIGYDMDYTLIHYFMEGWERSAYGYIKTGLLGAGWPVEDFEFDDKLVARGLIIDRQLGNLVKANRFGYVKRAAHGTRMLDFDEQRKVYARTQIDLRDDRWVFLNTLFSISEACMYMQCVDLLDDGTLPATVNYGEVYAAIRTSLDAAHAEGKLKAEILADPDRFVELDPDIPLALLDQKMAGKTLLLITNSEFAYAAPMLKFAFDRFLPDGMRWQDLFHSAIFTARKPTFFDVPVPAFRVVDEDQRLLQENHGPMEKGGLYVGGNAAWVERSLNLAGGQILYVGDHLFVDVNVAKSVLRWRTALIIRELDNELAALEGFASRQEEIMRLMAQKQAMEFEYSQLRLDLQRIRRGYGPQSGDAKTIEGEMGTRREAMRALDQKITPLAVAAGSLVNARWGPLFRAGNDKSHLARQVERYADVYTSRVSNFATLTPFEYLRSPRGSLPHDPSFSPR